MDIILFDTCYGSVMNTIELACYLYRGRIQHHSIKTIRPLINASFSYLIYILLEYCSGVCFFLALAVSYNFLSHVLHRTTYTKLPRDLAIIFV